MNIHEYQAKEIFRKYGIPIPPGDPLVASPRGACATRPRASMGYKDTPARIAALMRLGALGWPAILGPDALALRTKGQPSGNTTIAVVATDALLTKPQLVPLTRIQKLRVQQQKKCEAGGGGGGGASGGGLGVGVVGGGSSSSMTTPVTVQPAGSSNRV